MIYSVHLISDKWVIFLVGDWPTHHTGAFADIGAAKDGTQAKKMSIGIHLVSFGWIVSVFIQICDKLIGPPTSSFLTGNQLFWSPQVLKQQGNRAEAPRLHKLRISQGNQPWIPFKLVHCCNADHRCLFPTNWLMKAKPSTKASVMLNGTCNSLIQSTPPGKKSHSLVNHHFPSFS